MDYNPPTAPAARANSTLGRTKVGANEVEEEYKVVEPAELAEALQSQDWTVVFFFNPQCVHCQALMPKVHSASYLLHAVQGRRILAVDCSVYRNLPELYKVPHYPYLAYFQGSTLKGNMRTSKEAGSTDIILWIDKLQHPESYPSKGKVAVGGVNFAQTELHSFETARDSSGVECVRVGGTFQVGFLGGDTFPFHSGNDCAAKHSDSATQESSPRPGCAAASE